MKIQDAILASALIIAFSLVFIFRWEVSTDTKHVYRLDRWSGTVANCALSQAGYIHRAAGRPVNLDCEEK